MERIIVKYLNDDDRIIWSEAPEIPWNYNGTGWLEELKDKIRGGINFGATKIEFDIYDGGDLVSEHTLGITAI